MSAAALNAIVAAPEPLARAPRVGVLVATEKAADPVPEIDASKVPVGVKVMVASPVPKAINSPDAGATVNTMAAVPVVVMPPAPAPLIDNEISALFRLDMPPALGAMSQDPGCIKPSGTDDLLAIDAPATTVAWPAHQLRLAPACAQVLRSTACANGAPM